ncbi:hypothetical protein AB0B31_36435 [Catellatospora citrea]|uniref:TlpA family protein disulfide reductase n=1 Tax=Catellatospora citrea TaxID=53366 RepID=UPI00340C33DF
MIVALWTAVALAAAVAIAALALGLLLARRYRELHSAVSQRPAAATPAYHLPPVGAAVSEFRTATTGGEPLTSDDLNGDDVTVAVLMVGCTPCTEEVPALREAFAAVPAGADRPVAVIVSESAGAGPAMYVAELGPVARVVVEEPGGEVSTALGVSGYPAVLVVGRGHILQAGTRVADIAVPVAA